MLPQANAKLLEVAAGGASEDWNTPAGAGTPEWAGEADAYYREKRERVAEIGNSDTILRRILIVETSIRNWSEGEIVTFQTEADAGPTTGKVQMIERSSLQGVGNKATTRLTLEVK